MLVDIDRVEVCAGLRALFGTNSLAGTVRILFKRPIWPDARRWRRPPQR
jgi:hypothetical protein